MVIYYLHIHSDTVTHNHILAVSLTSNKSEVDSNYFPELTESARLVKDASRARLSFFIHGFAAFLHSGSGTDAASAGGLSGLVME